MLIPQVIWLFVENQCFVLFAILTSINMTGTSVRTPTIVASAAGLCVPNNEIATATANSKKLDAPIMAAGALYHVEAL